MAYIRRIRSVIRPSDMNVWLRDWLRLNDIVNEREYVGMGFMVMKEWIIAHTDDNKLLNSEIKIYDSDGDVAAELVATEKSFFNLFQKKFRVVGNTVNRHDWVQKFTRSVGYLLGLVKTAVMQTLHLAAPVARKAIGLPEISPGFSQTANFARNPQPPPYRRDPTPVRRAPTYRLNPIPNIRPPAYGHSDAHNYMNGNAGISFYRQNYFRFVFGGDSSDDDSSDDSDYF